MDRAASIPGDLVEALRDARHVAVLTGSGISAESGIPTFRDAQTGLWARYDPLELATPEAFERDPKLVWDWYSWRRQLVLDCRPNAAHAALVRLANAYPTFSLVTQNVDGLHQRAGSRDVIEYHGNLFVDRCSAEQRIVDRAASRDDLPICPDCGAPLRPGVVWFGEPIPPDAMARAAAAAADCNVFLSVGTSSLVWPAAGLAEEAKRHGALTAEINLNPTSMSDAFDYRLTGKAGGLLPELVDCLVS